MSHPKSNNCTKRYAANGGQADARANQTFLSELAFARRDVPSTRPLALPRCARSDSNAAAACAPLPPDPRKDEKTHKTKHQLRQALLAQEQERFSGRQTDFSTGRLPRDREATYFIGSCSLTRHQACAICTGLDNTPIP